MASTAVNPRAHVQLLAPNQGGRATPVMNGYAPHLVVEGSQEYLGVRFLGMSEPLRPGSAVDLDLELLYPNVDYKALVSGVKFTVREGPNVIGHGHILDQ